MAGDGDLLTAEWRYLVMLSHEVDPALLAPLVPVGTALDACHGRLLATLVGFRFLNTRVLGVPVPFHRSFDEVNLRFDVRRHLPNGDVRRGRGDLVPRLAVALLARLAYHEPYRAVPVRSTLPAEPVGPAASATRGDRGRPARGARPDLRGRIRGRTPLRLHPTA